MSSLVDTNSKTKVVTYRVVEGEVNAGVFHPSVLYRGKVVLTGPMWFLLSQLVLNEPKWLLLNQSGSR